MSRVEKPLSKWLICAVCGVPLQAARTASVGAANDPLVTFVTSNDGGTRVQHGLAHSSCVPAAQEPSRAITIAQDKEANRTYGVGVCDDKFGLSIAPFVSDDARAVVTYVGPNNFIVSRTVSTTYTRVVECFKDSCVTASRNYVTLYRQRTGSPVGAVLVPVRTRAFSASGAVELLYMARGTVPKHAADNPQPLPPPGTELVYYDYTPRLSPDGKEVSVGATRVAQDRAHVFVCVNRGKMLVFSKRAGAGKQLAVKPQCTMTTDQADVDGMRRTLEGDGYECYEF